ncbi:hypothetical protein MCA0035 [Methylococcus capsulatus str. Bath]|uniref:Uncharacterized protein n=1 Tax=Methylococcus capsulatus (strain ATCC 33009 / NCIMB 11132 / Bath) TaxID=243233 RepID=Q60CT1_METCA|nr:hypothetical protein [Methylococcus capsulatus]AAU90847.1 hypothetical protein MCA0035 [Methylococcus capsulatus str. Bath]
MSTPAVADPSLRLRPWASLVLFLSAYSPLMLILIIKDYDAVNPGWLPQNPVFSGTLLLVAVFSSLAVLRSVKEIDGGLTVTVTKASNKSGDMFGYTIPYMLSFMKVDLGDWQTIVSLVLFLGILFIMAYRTQTVFVNPILALAGYMLIDCTFRRGDKEIQAMVVTRQPLAVGDTCRLERLSHYLYVAARDSSTPEEKRGKA